MLVSGLLIDMVVLIWYYFRTKVRYVPNQATILLAASRFNRTGGNDYEEYFYAKVQKDVRGIRTVRVFF